MKKNIIIGLILGFAILQGQINTENMRSQYNRDGCKNQFNFNNEVFSFGVLLIRDSSFRDKQKDVENNALCSPLIPFLIAL